MSSPDQQIPDQQITVPKFAAMKAAGRKITMLTAYDYAMAGLLDSTGIEGILVGDSLGMVVQGHPNTLPVTLDEMIYHAEMVGRAVRHAPGANRPTLRQGNRVANEFAPSHSNRVELDYSGDYACHSFKHYPQGANKHRGNRYHNLNG